MCSATISSVRYCQCWETCLQLCSVALSNRPERHSTHFYICDSGTLYYITHSSNVKNKEVSFLRGIHSQDVDPIIMVKMTCDYIIPFHIHKRPKIMTKIGTEADILSLHCLMMTDLFHVSARKKCLLIFWRLTLLLFSKVPLLATLQFFTHWGAATEQTEDLVAKGWGFEPTVSIPHMPFCLVHDEPLQPIN